jgi:hypothetical protein
MLWDADRTGMRRKPTQSTWSLMWRLIRESGHFSRLRVPLSSTASEDGSLPAVEAKDSPEASERNKMSGLHRPTGAAMCRRRTPGERALAEEDAVIHAGVEAGLSWGSWERATSAG